MNQNANYVMECGPARVLKGSELIRDRGKRAEFVKRRRKYSGRPRLREQRQKVRRWFAGEFLDESAVIADKVIPDGGRIRHNRGKADDEARGNARFHVATLRR